MKRLKLSAISYLNTVPFVYGLRNSGYSDDFDITFDVPSSCAEKLMHDQTDIGIVPVASIPIIPGAGIITEYCIGAVGPVRTVILAGNQPLDNISTIYLDTHSRTSVQLVRILAQKYWHKEFLFLPLSEKPLETLAYGEAAVLIGDKTFGLEKKFEYILDLSAEWTSFTGLPFVFACWVANKPIPQPLYTHFISAIEYGISHRKEAAGSVEKARYPGVDIEDYLVNVISYELDHQKRQGMALFLELMAQNAVR